MNEPLREFNWSMDPPSPKSTHTHTHTHTPHTTHSCINIQGPWVTEFTTMSGHLGSSLIKFLAARIWFTLSRNNATQVPSLKEPAGGLLSQWDKDIVKPCGSPPEAPPWPPETFSPRLAMALPSGCWNESELCFPPHREKRSWQSPFTLHWPCRCL